MLVSIACISNGLSLVPTSLPTISSKATVRACSVPPFADIANILISVELFVTKTEPSAPNFSPVDTSVRPPGVKYNL